MFRITELQLRADQPESKARALADILGADLEGRTGPEERSVLIGDTAVTFFAGGPEGRPELYGERFA